MLDANIIVSAILFPKSIVSESIKDMILNHKLIISQYTIEEIIKVFNRKFPHRINEMDEFMEKLPYKLYISNEIEYKKYPSIRDIKDKTILENAIESNVDVLVTGDKDFDEVKIKKPKIINPRKYIDEYMM